MVTGGVNRLVDLELRRRIEVGDLGSLHNDINLRDSIGQDDFGIFDSGTHGYLATDGHGLARMTLGAFMISG